MLVYISPRLGRFVLSFGLSLACASAPQLSSLSYAQDDAEEIDARFAAAIEKAKAAFDKGDYDQAVSKLQEANRLRPDSRLVYNIARSYEKKGDCVKTLAYLKAFTQIKDAPENLIKDANRDLKKGRKACKDFSDELSGRLMVETTPEGATISVDGQEVGEAPFETIAMKPGEYALVLALEGYQPLKTKLVIESGQLQKREAYALKPVVKEPVVSDTKPKEDTNVVVEPIDDPLISPKEEQGYSPSIPAIAVMGAGAVVLGVGLYYDLSVIPGIDDQRREPNITQEDFDKLTDDRSGAATIALVSYIAGGALLAGGAAWLAYDFVSYEEPKPGDKAQGKIELRMMPLIGPDRAGVGFSGRF